VNLLFWMRIQSQQCTGLAWPCLKVSGGTIPIVGARLATDLRKRPAAHQWGASTRKTFGYTTPLEKFTELVVLRTCLITKVTAVPTPFFPVDVRVD